MGKREEIDRLLGANIDESMGRHPAAVHGAPPAAARAVPARLQGLRRRGDVADIPLDRIARDPSQPREEFEPEALGRLADSLRARGQLQPIRVRWDEGQGSYVILVGERRWRAAQLAGLPTLACVVVEGPLDDAERLSIQLVENALREDLRPIEQARAYRTLMEARGWSARQLAQELAISHPSVVRALALLDLPAPVQTDVEQGTLAPATAYEVSKLDDPHAQAELARTAVAEGLTRSEVAEAVQTIRARRPEAVHGVPSRPAPAEFRLDDGTLVVVRPKKGSRLTTVQALRQALKLAQSRADDQAA